MSYFPLKNSFHTAPLPRLFIFLSWGLFDGLSKCLPSKTAARDTCHFDSEEGLLSEKLLSFSVAELLFKAPVDRKCENQLSPWFQGAFFACSAHVAPVNDHECWSASTAFIYSGNEF